MKNYHVFFTTQYTKECIEHCCFGASVSNSLANVKAGDCAFLFDGLKWAIFGPFEIISDQQCIDERAIYGVDKRGNTKYKNRVWFKVDGAKETSLTKLYAIERNPLNLSFILNRYLLATLIANKQVNSTTITQSEGQYLMDKCLEHGKSITSIIPIIPPNIMPVFPNSILRHPISEAGVEVLILNKKCHGYLFDFLDSFPSHCNFFNQFVLGFQRQVDVLIDAHNRLAVLEIKKKNNIHNPFEQLIEYGYYCLSSFRLYYTRSSPILSVDLVAVVEKGSRFLADYFTSSFISECAKMTNKENVQINPHIVVYNFSKSGLLETKQYAHNVA